jgi:hypothetical protein
VLAHNIVASVRGEALRPFRFKTVGLLASIGRRTGVARILGVNFSGFLAWWLWRTIYLLKLPRLEKKLRVALDWTLDLFFTKDFVQYLHERSPTIDDVSTVHVSGAVREVPRPSFRQLIKPRRPAYLRRIHNLSVHKPLTLPPNMPNDLDAYLIDCSRTKQSGLSMHLRYSSDKSV